MDYRFPPVGPSRRNRLCLVGVWLFAGTALHAAPPKVDYLFPGGAARGTTATVTVGGTVEPWPPQVWASRPEVQVTAAETKGQLAVVIPPDAAPGVCWIRLTNAEGAAVPRPFLISQVPDVLDVEPNNEPAKAQPLATLPVIVNGQLAAAGDVDVFAVNLAAGATLVAALEANRPLGSPMDGVLQVLSPQGFVLGHADDDPDLDPRLVYTARESGTFLVRLFAFPEQGTSNIALSGQPNFVYRLTLTTGAYVDHVEPLAISGHPVNAQPVNVKLFGWNLPDAARVVPLTPLPDVTALSVFSPDLANVRFVTVEPHAAILEEGATTAAEPQQLTLPVTVTGGLSAAGDVDEYAFTATKGESYVIAADGRSLGAPIDLVLAVADPMGKVLQRVDDQQTNHDPELVFAASADGEFRVRVTDLHGRGGERVVYRLRVLPRQPDFRLTLAADSVICTPGKPQEIAVTIDRRYGFAEEIEIVAVGLPAGVTAEPVKSTAAAAKLILNATAASPSGPIRVEGRTLGPPPRSRRATFVAAGNTALEDVWLTIIPAP